MSKNSKENVGRRRTQMLEIIAKNELVSIDAMAEEMGVSSMTVRRDLSALEEQNFIRRLSGGMVSLRDQFAVDLDFTRRKASHHDEKAAIAQMAAGLIDSGEVLGLDASTSVLELGGLLVSKKDLVVVTNNLIIPPLLSANEKMEIISAGGALRAKAMSTVGAIACDVIDRFVYDKVFLSCNAVDAEMGLTDTEMDEIQTKMAFLRNARQCIVLADHSKLGKIAYQKLCPIHQINVLITDNAAPPSIVEAFEKKGVTVMIAKLEGL